MAEIDFEFDAPPDDTPALVLGKKKKKKKVVDPDEASDPTLSDLLLKKKKKKKKKVEDGDEAGDAAGAADDPAPAEESAPADDEPVLSLGLKKKKKKKKNRLDDLTEPGEGAGADAGDAPPTGAFSTFGIDDGEDPAADAHGKGGDDADEMPASPVGKKDKKKGKGKKPVVTVDDEDFDSILAELGGPAGKDANGGKPANELDAELDTMMSSVASKKKKGKKKAAAKPAADDDDLDALLAELDEKPKAAASASNAEPAASNDIDDMMAELGDAPSSTVSKKKKKKGKAAPKPAEDEDLDALLAELDEKPKDGATAPADASGSKDVADDVDAMMAEMDVGDGAGLSAAAAKRKKKKAKQAAKKAEEPGKDDAAPAPKKGGKKESAAVKRLREQQERKAAEEVRLAELRAEEERQRAEEERLEKEREEAKERSRLAKKEAEKARKARLKAEGKLLSKAEAAKKRKAEAYKQQMIAQGLIPAAASGAAAANGKSSEGGGRVVYSSKKRNRGKPQGEGATVAESESPKAEGPETPLADAETAETAGTAATPDSEAASPVADASGASVVVEPAADVKAEDHIPDVPFGHVPEEWDAEEEDAPEPDTAVENVVEVSAGKAGKPGSSSANGAGAGPSSAGAADSDSESESDSDDERDGMSRAEVAAEKRREKLRKTRTKEAEAAKAARSPDDLRSPIVCILGHVDTGKTKILDRIRRTNVQDGEAGGITQQIGASYFPIDAVKKEVSKVEDGRDVPYNVPSLLIIDTPGHESFTNLRSRGSSLCDIAILVIDIMHGLEPQTRESIDLLKLRRTPFIIALNKIDRMYSWEAQKGNCPVRKTLDKQNSDVMSEFRRRVDETKLELASIGFNTELYWENDDVRRNISIVPTSAITGEGMPDLLMLLLELPQKLLVDRLMFSPILEATVLEVKVIEGLGTTIDIVLTGGKIRSGDTIFVVGLEGPIQATIRALLTPHPMKEMRVKGQYMHHKEIRAAQGIKISADGLDKAVAGTQLLVARDSNDEDELEFLRDEVMKDFTTILQSVDKSGVGVYVQASTLGSLEALLEFLRTSKVPVSGINIGPVHKKDIVKCSTMLERHKEYAAVLAFDVPVEREARTLADDLGVVIFTADIIYNLFDMFTEHLDVCRRTRREEQNDDVVFPCVLTILPEHVYNKKSPLVLGVEVSEGILRVGNPLVVKNGNTWLDIGRAVSMELNKKPVQIAKRGESVALKIYSAKTEHVMYGRHFDWKDKLVSKMSRSAIDILKESFRDDLATEDWRLVVKMKSWFDII